MNNANPLVPRGSLLEQQARGRPHLRVAVVIVVVHLIFLGGLLIQGCKRDEEPTLADGQRPTNDVPARPVGLPDLFGTSAPPVLIDEPDHGGFIEPEPLPGPDVTPEPKPPEPAVTNEPPVIPPPLPEPAYRDYTVAAGESFFSIARKLGLTPEEIAAANPNVDPLKLQINQVIKVPTHSKAPTAADLPAGQEIYEVKKDDTLYGIARARGTTVETLMKLNGLSTYRINVGQKLKVPVKSTAGGSTAP